MDGRNPDSGSRELFLCTGLGIFVSGLGIRRSLGVWGMAGRGPAPKDPSQRRRRNSPPSPPALVEVPGAPVGPELPETHEWPAATLAWWATWRTCPQASTFTDTDWAFLLDTAVLHAEFWLGNLKVAAELRLRAAKFGATPEDRARLKIAAGDPTGIGPMAGPAASTGPRLKATTKAADRRKRLLRAVGDGGDT